MKRPNFRNRTSERGMTLIEALVAMLVFTVVFMAALALYQSANKAYLQTDAATIQQQNIRYAMDRVVSTVRDAGANYNPLGSQNLPDEQIEGAWESAIVVRGDFDSEREGTGSEQNLESGTFPIVSVGSNEIVAYVLRKPTDSDNDIPLTLTLDTSAPRNGTMTWSGGTGTPGGEETVTLNVAASTLAEQTDPPYQLARVTLNTSGAPVYEVVAENIFRLSFEYLNANGVAITGAANGGGNADRAARASVRRVAVNLIGMADRPDLGYTDTATYSPAEGPATKRYRKFRLSERIWPVNLGLKGKIHNPVPTLALAAPATLTVCTGHCLNYFITWPASVTAGVSRYRVHVTATGVDEYFEVAGLSAEFEQRDVTIQDYNFSVAPLSNIGLEGTYSSVVTKVATHTPTTIPSVPANVTAARAGTSYAMQVMWDPVATNIAPITTATCSTSGGGVSIPPEPWASRAVDLKPYRVHRVRSDAPGATTNFTADASNRIETQTLGELQNVAPEGSTFIDRTAAPCEGYYYKVQACDLCDVTSLTASLPMGALVSYNLDTETTTRPAKPASAPVPMSPVVLNPVPNGNYTLRLQWPEITRTEGGRQARTSHYELRREQKIGAAGTWTFDSVTDVTPIHDSTQMPSNHVLPSWDTLSSQRIYYRYTVRGIYDCTTPGPRNGDFSDPYYVACTPPNTHTLSITSPIPGAEYSRPVESAATPQLTMTGTGWTNAQIDITDSDGVNRYTGTINGAPSSFVYTFSPAWDFSALPDGVYTIKASAEVASCRADATATIRLTHNTCGLQLSNAVVGPATGTPSDRFKRLQFDLTNTCDNAGITINQFTAEWSGGANPTTTTINSIVSGATTLVSGQSAGSGTAVTLGTNVTVPANSSRTIQIFYTEVMSGTTWSSILARLATTPASTDETVETDITPPNQ